MMSPPNKEARNNSKQLNGDECGNPNLNEMPTVALTQIHSDQDDEEDQNNQDNNNDSNYDQHGQIVYQQLQSDDYQNLNENDTNDEDNSDGFDDFQYLAESRANSKRSPSSQARPIITDDDNDIFKQKKLESENIQIDSSKSEIISNIMKNIKISTDCIPDWAKVIPEQLWRKNLIENISVKQTNLFTPQTTTEQQQQQQHETPSSNTS